MSGAFKQGLRELRFHLCQTGEGSAALRNYLTSTYPKMKQSNPNIPIMIREASGVEPKVWARYEYGREKMEPLAGLDSAGIQGKVSSLVQS